MSRSLIPADERIAALENQVRGLNDVIRQLNQKLARGGDPRNPRLARTVAFSSSYPTRQQGYNVYWIRFCDVTHDATVPAIKVLDVTERSSGDPVTLACNIQPDPYVPEDSLVAVFWDNGKWWFDYTTPMFRGRLTETLTAGGSADVQPQQDDGAGGYEDAPGDPVTVYDDVSTSMTGVSGDICLVHWDRNSQKYWFVQKECSA